MLKEKFKFVSKNFLRLVLVIIGIFLIYNGGIYVSQYISLINTDFILKVIIVAMITFTLAFFAYKMCYDQIKNFYKEELFKFSIINRLNNILSARDSIILVGTKAYSEFMIESSMDSFIKGNKLNTEKYTILLSLDELFSEKELINEFDCNSVNNFFNKGFKDFYTISYLEGLILKNNFSIKKFNMRISQEFGGNMITTIVIKKNNKNFFKESN